MATGLTLLIMKMASLMFLATGLAGIFNKNIYQKIMDDTLKNTGLTFMWGFIAFLAGFAIVIYHNIWTASWEVLVTIIGWLGLIKGLSLMIFPKALGTVSKSVFKGSLAKIIPYTTIILGLIFGYFGFFA